MENPELLNQKRHSLAHLLAAAVAELWPEAQNTIGPAIDHGFYYDFANLKITEADLAKIEKKMRELLPTWDKFKRQEISAAEAKKTFAGNPYKLELIEEIEKLGEPITLYQSGQFVDLCRGGHVNSAQEIKSDSFKLDRVAGAYWRGEEKNAMLTRIYGLAFETKADLDNFLKQREEAEKRDHKKLGRELDLFTISPLVGAGLPLLKPKGMVIRQAIENYLWDLHRARGYQRVWTPHIARESLYITSGHAAKFGDELFRVQGKEEKFFLKPMNCPHHMQIFADNQFSYREMPVRYFEPATVYRDEKSGQLGGLTRVRSITQDDGHLFCRVSQLEAEASTIIEIIKTFYGRMKMLENYWVRLSVRGPGGQYIGSDEIWTKAEKILEDTAKANNLPYQRVEGEAAFYGPKLDFMFKDAIGREWQLATIQCDFNLPERFDLSFINEKGEKERPVVIHRAISGSLERFLGFLIEHFAGAFPLWLAPLQVRVLPIGEAHQDFAREIVATLKQADFRVDLDQSGESLGKKIRQFKLEKIPYAIVIGDKEVAEKKLTIESRDAGKLEGLTTESLIEKLKGEEVA